MSNVTSLSDRKTKKFLGDFQKQELKFDLKKLKNALNEATKKGYVGKNIFNSQISIDIYDFIGAGAYICGEESAMIESIEGKRGYPRHRPPYVAEVGIFNKPTLVNNIETLFWIRDIIEKGPTWFSDQGKEGHPGLRSYSVSGRVKQPGVKIAPAGSTVRELIDNYCGGMQNGHEFRAYLPGGASGGILPANMDNLPLDFGQLEQHGCFVGSHAVVILSLRHISEPTRPY